VQQLDKRIDLTARHKNGSEFPIEVTLSPVETVNGTLVTVAIRDITERRRADQEMKYLSQLHVPQPEMNAL
jgi:PAS domain S-box-containing protein